ncbi:MAG: ChaN family lipoprotein, partial [Bacteroidales bacterium]
MENKNRVQNRIVLFAFLPLLLGFAVADKPAYVLFTGSGESISYSTMLDSLLKADVVFFGELHNNAISHWMELEIAMDLYRADSSALVMGAEMFERDNQVILDEYLSGLIRERDFEAGARLWNNHKTDYKPLISFAAEKGVPFIATNIPRRYAAMVNSKGFEALEGLSPEAKRWIAPLPVPYDPELPGYKAMAAMGGPAMHANNNLPRAQAIKDATMAWFITSGYEPGKRFLHFNGSY